MIAEAGVTQRLNLRVLDLERQVSELADRLARVESELSRRQEVAGDA